MVGIPNLTISQNQDATMKTILQLPGQDVLQWSSQLLRKRWISLDQTQLAVSIHDLVEILKGS